MANYLACCEASQLYTILDTNPSSKKIDKTKVNTHTNHSKEKLDWTNKMSTTFVFCKTSVDKNIKNSMIK